MDDAFLVRGGQAGGDLLGVLDGLARRQRKVIQPRAQYFAFEHFGDEVRRAFVIANVMDRQDVRMVERRGRSRLLLESAQSAKVLGELGGQDLDCNLAVEPSVAGLVDLAHPARAERSENFVWAQNCACGNVHFGASTVQFITTLIGGAAARSFTTPTRKRCPSRLGA